MTAFTGRDRVIIALAVVFAALAGAATFGGWGSTFAFVASAVALAGVAALVGRSVDALAGRLGPAKTGIVQSAVGNLPELFVCIFALQAGLLTVVQAAIVGSVLSNVLLVLGAAFLVGGLRHGSQRFDAFDARRIGVLLLLAVSALAFPTLTDSLHTPADGHEREFSVFVSIALLTLFLVSVIASIRSTSRPQVPAQPGPVRSGQAQQVISESEGPKPWPFAIGLIMLVVSGLLAALVSDWFVDALTPTMNTLGIPEAFAGLVIVAIAGNAVENFVGISLAARNRPDFALQVTLQSPLQVVMFVAPVLVLIAPLVGAAGFTLVLSPLLVACLLLSAIIAMFIMYDGESNWLEGAMLVTLYAVIAAAFWWG
ncbi:MAG: calcium/proton exchanger [Actinomycetales bacterium]